MLSFLFPVGLAWSQRNHISDILSAAAVDEDDGVGADATVDADETSAAVNDDDGVDAAADNDDSIGAMLMLFLLLPLPMVLMLMLLHLLTVLRTTS